MYKKENEFFNGLDSNFLMSQQAVRKYIIFAIDITSQSMCFVQYQKIYEKIMEKIIRDHKKNDLTPYLCGGWKGYITQ